MVDEVVEEVDEAEESDRWFGRSEYVLLSRTWAVSIGWGSGDVGGELLPLLCEPEVIMLAVNLC